MNKYLKTDHRICSTPKKTYSNLFFSFVTAINNNKEYEYENIDDHIETHNNKLIYNILY